MSLFLDIDRARSVFRLLFLCCSDERCTEPLATQFDDALREITLGVQVPSSSLKKLRNIHREVVSQPAPLRSVAIQVAREFADDRELLSDVFRIVLRIANDEGMLSRKDCSRVREIARCFEFRMAELDNLSIGERVIFESCLTDAYEARGLEDLEVYFEALGCTMDMSEGEIRSRFRQLAKQYHPDRSTVRGDHSDSRHEFEKVQEAFSMLKQHFNWS